jgi:hypothetical protein
VGEEGEVGWAPARLFLPVYGVLVTLRGRELTDGACATASTEEGRAEKSRTVELEKYFCMKIA